MIFGYAMPVVLAFHGYGILNVLGHRGAQPNNSWVANIFILLPKTFPTDLAANFRFDSFLSDKKLNICALLSSSFLNGNFREAIKSSNNLIHAE